MEPQLYNRPVGILLWLHFHLRIHCKRASLDHQAAHFHFYPFCCSWTLSQGAWHEGNFRLCRHWTAFRPSFLCFHLHVICLALGVGPDFGVGAMISTILLLVWGSSRSDLDEDEGADGEDGDHDDHEAWWGGTWESNFVIETLCAWHEWACLRIIAELVSASSGSWSPWRWRSYANWWFLGSICSCKFVACQKKDICRSPFAICPVDGPCALAAQVTMTGAKVRKRRHRKMRIQWWTPMLHCTPPKSQRRHWRGTIHFHPVLHYSLEIILWLHPLEDIPDQHLVDFFKAST